MPRLSTSELCRTYWTDPKAREFVDLMSELQHVNPEAYAEMVDTVRRLAAENEAQS